MFFLMRIWGFGDPVHLDYSTSGLLFWVEREVIEPFSMFNWSYSEVLWLSALRLI